MSTATLAPPRAALVGARRDLAPRLALVGVLAAAAPDALAALPAVLLLPAAVYPLPSLLAWIGAVSGPPILGVAGLPGAWGAVPLVPLVAWAGAGRGRWVAGATALAAGPSPLRLRLTSEAAGFPAGLRTPPRPPWSMPPPGAATDGTRIVRTVVLGGSSPSPP